MSNDLRDTNNGAVDDLVNETHQFGKRKRHAALKHFDFERIHMYAEFLSFLAIIVAAPIALLELRNHNIVTAESDKKDRIQVAEKTYREVDDKYTDFLKVCLEHPRLDCYSVPRTLDKKLTDDEQWQQNILYTALTDVFEVAYVQYKTNQYALDPEIRDIFTEQWGGWDTYIKKFLLRPAYRKVYWDICNEYDVRLVAYMDAIVGTPCPVKPL
jgi:hypothetical protein